MNTSAEAFLKAGTIIDNKWIIIEMIGKGAMGEVYRAHQINLKRDVAVKIISDEMLQELEDDPDEMAVTFKRFQREVQTMAQVRHYNILNIFDYGVYTLKPFGKEDEKSVEYIVMEYIPGNTLRFTMSDDGLDDVPELFAQWVKTYFLPILEGVKAMHHHDIFHRDLKPENIFMDGEIPKIADFGLARSHQLKAVSNSMEMKGTLTYMAPEQFSDFRKADQTADIYALGKMLFEAVDGKLGKKTLPLKQVSLQHYKNLDIPFLEKMDTIIQKATTENKAERFHSVEELQTSVLKALDRSLVLVEGSDLQTRATDLVQKHSQFIWAGIVIVLIAITGMISWHMKDGSEKISSLISQGEHLGVNDTGVDIPENLVNLKNQVISRDGSNMMLTGNMDEIDPEGQTSSNAATLFYMDDKKISNFLFMEFLNSIKDQLMIESGIVKHDGIVLFYIGTGTQAEDQIIFQHQQFHLKNQDLGSKPVTRVTYHGALAYASFYGKTLLMESEWRFAYLYHLGKYRDINPETKKQKPLSNFERMHGFADKKAKPEEPVILDSMGVGIREWVKIPSPGNMQSPPDIQPHSGVLDSTIVKNKKNPVYRQQWEGFPDVGFRTKIRIR